MTVETKADWERHPDGTYISIPIRYRDLDDVREWCAQTCHGDFIIDLGRHVLFQCWGDAALATLWWRREERD